jgi:hypothetical protein
MGRNSCGDALERGVKTSEARWRNTGRRRRNALCAHRADRRCREGRDYEDGVLTARQLVPRT